MNFNCDKNVLLEAVSIVGKAIPAKSSNSVLESILLEINEDNRLRLVGYDLSIGIEMYLDIEVKEAGRILVNAKTFSDVLRSMENGTVYFSLDENMNLKIQCGVSKFILTCGDPAAYPGLPVIDDSTNFQINQNILHSMLRQVFFAVSTYDALPNLMGVFFDIKKDSITVAASDNLKLAIRKEKYENSNELSFIVPGKTVGEILKIMKDNEDIADIFLANKQIIFKIDNIKIISRLIDLNFINYNTYIPKTFKTNVILKSDEFKRAIDRASILVIDKIKNAVKLSFEFESIIISYRTNTGNSFTDEVTAEIKGDNLEIGFNNKYLQDSLASCECNEIELGLNSSLSTMKISPVNSDKFEFYISPMRLRND